MRIDTRLHTLPGPGLALLLAIVCLLAVPAQAGEKKTAECLSSKMANELMDCAHCQAMKQLLNHRAIGAVSMEVHELASGAVVEIEAASPKAVKLVHSLVDEIWNTSAHCETTLSQVCKSRYLHLEKVAVETATSDHGAIVVLRADAPADVTWLREDARNTRSYVLAAASR